jgi:RNA polymerase sigma factor (sigma-70 family)
MDVIDQHERVIKILKRARRSEEEITPESLEENLRWLVRVAVPEVGASDALRQRVRTLAVLPRFWRWERPPRLFGEDRRRLPAGPEELWLRTQWSERFDGREEQLLQLLLTADVRLLPEDALLREEAQEVVRQLMEWLPEPQREALLLQVRHGLSLREIAQVMGLSEAQTSALLRQARTFVFRRHDSRGDDDWNG